MHINNYKLHIRSLLKYNRVLRNFTMTFPIIQPKNMKFSTQLKKQNPHIFSSYLLCVKNLNSGYNDCFHTLF